MITFAEALKIVLENARPLPMESLPLSKLPGKVLAEAILTPFPLPRFDNTAVDGYAVHSDEYRTASPESPLPLTVSQTIRAGDSALEPMQSHQAIRIMTGAPIPSGTDAVVMREDVESAEGFFIRRPARPGENIRRRGEELPEGAVVLKCPPPTGQNFAGYKVDLGFLYLILTSCILSIPVETEAGSAGVQPARG